MQVAGNINTTAVFAGIDPRTNKPYLYLETQGERRLDDKPGELAIDGSMQTVVQAPGAGGYGKPAESAPDAVGDDQRSGIFTAEYLGWHYPDVVQRR